MTSTPHDALTAPTVATSTVPRGALPALARLEAGRLARHPAFVGGTAFGIVSTAMALSEEPDQVTGNALGLPVVALTVGLGAMLAAYRITRSFDRADELVEAAPTSTTARTAALCVITLIPCLVASWWLVFYYGFTPAALDAPDWMYGVFSHSEIATVIVGNSVVAAAGATLLGIAAGRWWRFRGASAVLVILVAVWTLTVMSAFSGDEASPPAWHRWVRLFAPLSGFTTVSENTDSVLSLTGSPWWYFVWLLTLCALAGLAALLWRSEGQTRRRLVRAGGVLVAVSLVTYVLAASGGLSEPVRSYPDGPAVVTTK
ncbi:hypothetical protein [Humibacillus xanthopallidus]|uniref:Uncharacterized protein n=1 Tax=Humibacillus xanthopallidus TaxID=412689 RepID=A0A543H8H3_9MICO|nr:hypothetical protein [Humibacillus xanthopallidus]TQM54600.1 hypothetical protein FBY41_4638 [Humibacillus xanthopallidus]